MKLNVRGLFDRNGRLQNSLTETDGNGDLPILAFPNGWKRRFANFAFPSWMEMEVLLISDFRNGRKWRFADFMFPSRMKMEIPFPSQTEIEFLFPSISVKPIFCFPCQALLTGTQKRSSSFLLVEGNTNTPSRVILQAPPSWLARSNIWGL